MKRKIVSILICMLLITSTLVLFNPEHPQVKASPDEGEGSIDFALNRDNGFFAQ